MASLDEERDDLPNLEFVRQRLRDGDMGTFEWLFKRLCPLCEKGAVWVLRRDQDLAHDIGLEAGYAMIALLQSGRSLADWTHVFRLCVLAGKRRAIGKRRKYKLELGCDLNELESNPDDHASDAFDRIEQKSYRSLWIKAFFRSYPMALFVFAPELLGGEVHVKVLARRLNRLSRNEFCEYFAPLNLTSIQMEALWRQLLAERPLKSSRIFHLRCRFRKYITDRVRKPFGESK